MWAVRWHVRILATPIKSFLPCDITYAISEPRPSAILSHGGQRSRVKFARAEGLGMRLVTGFDVHVLTPFLVHLAYHNVGHTKHDLI